jgi:hypothetical protein
MTPDAMIATEITGLIVVLIGKNCRLNVASSSHAPLAPLYSQGLLAKPAEI